MDAQRTVESGAARRRSPLRGVSEVAKLPRGRGNGTRNAATVITVYSLVFAVALVAVAIGLDTAQSWLERRTYQKHAGD
jgi:hypothetical protein